MSFLKWVIRPYLQCRYHFDRLTESGPFGEEAPVLLKKSYVPSGNPMKDGLHRYHVKQFHESSCSVASVAGAVNTLLDLKRELPNPPLTQHDLLDNVRAAHWKERMGENGYKGRRGLPLKVLGEVVKASLDQYNIQYKRAETIQAVKDTNGSDACRKRLKKHLSRFEQQGDCLIIAHFDQGSYLPELHIPHISPVGGYDAERQTVKMLDVDWEQPHPYEISFDRFYQGISTDYNFIFNHYGYAEGGYVLVEI